MAKKKTTSETGKSDDNIEKSSNEEGLGVTDGVEVIDDKKPLDEATKKMLDEWDQELGIPTESKKEESKVEPEPVKQSEKINTVCSFRITVSDLDIFLNKLCCKGFDVSSKSATELINDCIIRFENNKMYSIVSEGHRHILCQASCKVEELKNPVDIPIDIPDLKSMLKSHENKKTVIEFIYENGFIALKEIATEKNQIDTTTAVYSTKRKEAVSNDLYQILAVGTKPVDIPNLKIITESGNTIYTLLNSGESVKLFFGVELKNHFVISADKFSKIITDGERIGNRIYPITFMPDRIQVTIKSPDEHKRDKIVRQIGLTNPAIKTTYMIEFGSRLTNAINNIEGDVICYTSEGMPLCIVFTCGSNNNIEVCYIITKR